MPRDYIPIDPDENLTPAEAERILKVLYNELGLAQLELRRARDRELDAKKAYVSERKRLLWTRECPHVGRGSDDVTVDERDAWIDNKIPDEFWVYEVAQSQRADADDYMSMLRHQVKCVQSISATTRQAYDISGRS
jgi:hypothetical protein